MGKGVLFLIIMVLFIGLASASYTCTGNISEVKDSVNFGEVEYINGVNIGLAASSFDSAEVLIDAEHITLTNQSPTKLVNIISGDYNVSIANITGNILELNVKTSSREAEEEDVTEIGGLQIYVLDFRGNYPGEDAYVNLLAGKYYQFFYSKEKTTKKTLNGVEYYFELLPSSISSAGFKVVRCQNGTLTYTNDTVTPTPPINSTPRANTTANNTQNPPQNNSSTDNQNETSNESITDGGSLEEVRKTMKERLMSTPFIIMFILFGVTLLIIIVMYIKSKISGIKPQTPTTTTS